MVVNPFRPITRAGCTSLKLGVVLVDDKLVGCGPPGGQMTDLQECNMDTIVDHLTANPDNPTIVLKFKRYNLD